MGHSTPIACQTLGPLPCPNPNPANSRVSTTTISNNRISLPGNSRANNCFTISKVQMTVILKRNSSILGNLRDKCRNATTTDLSKAIGVTKVWCLDNRSTRVYTMIVCRLRAALLICPLASCTKIRRSIKLGNRTRPPLPRSQVISKICALSLIK